MWKSTSIFIFLNCVISSICGVYVRNWRSVGKDVIFHHQDSEIPSPNGLNLTTSRTIIGGEPARVGEVPYQLSVRLNGRHICGAALVESPAGKHFALTAGHCTHDLYSSEEFAAEMLTVVGGSLIYNDTTYPAQEIGVRWIQRHSGYRSDHFPPRHDIAILFLNGRFKLNSLVRPIRLPSGEEEYQGKCVKVSGWGAVSQSILDNVPQYPKYLQTAKFQIVDLERCESSYPNRPIYSTNLCAGDMSGLVTPCNGDSGGPAIGDLSGRNSFRDRRKWVLVGLVSSAASFCATSNQPGIYTRVSSYKSWIVRNAVVNDIFGIFLG